MSSLIHFLRWPDLRMTYVEKLVHSALCGPMIGQHWTNMLKRIDFPMSINDVPVYSFLYVNQSPFPICISMSFPRTPIPTNKSTCFHRNEISMCISWLSVYLFDWPEQQLEQQDYSSLFTYFNLNQRNNMFHRNLSIMSLFHSYLSDWEPTFFIMYLYMYWTNFSIYDIHGTTARDLHVYNLYLTFLTCPLKIDDPWITAQTL